MESMEKWRRLSYGMTVVVMMSAYLAGSDQACMECPCELCTTYTCCERFTPRRLTKMYVAVNCSHPDQSRIIDPVTPVPKLVHTSSTCTGLHVVHEHGCLSAFPENYCRYPDAREVSLSYNKLSDIPDLKCLALLGRLDLCHNKLTRLTRDTFKGLKHIKEIFLDHNDIGYIHPSVLDELTELSIFSVSYNRLLTVDGWILNLRHKFCVINISHNQVQHLSNHGHWKFNMSKKVVYGPGLVDLTYNRMEGNVLGELSQFGIVSVLQMARYIHWGFDVRHNPIRCDCNIYQAVKWGKALAKIIWRDYFNVTCVSPPEFIGIPFVHLPLSALVCNITADCPTGCFCKNQPSKKAIFIFCKDVGLQSLPGVLPEGNHLVIHMANNSLNTLPPRQYLARTKRIDLRDSGLRVIEKDTPNLLRKVKWVDLRDNELHNLPSTFQVLDPGVVRLDLHTLRCSCDLHWMTAWLQQGHSEHLEDITCTKEDGKTIMLFNATSHDLCDKGNVFVYDTHDNYKIFIIVALSALLLVTCVLLVFRHEIIVASQVYRAQRRQRKRRQSDASMTPQQFDIFICMNVNSECDTKWVKNVLLPLLELRGLHSYLPLRDCPVGSVEMDELTKRMQDSATVLVVLSAEYVQSPACIFQFQQAYSHMLALRQGNLLVIRWGGGLSRRSVPEPRMRAMLTLSMFYTADLHHLHKALDKVAAHENTEI
ncbi:hypothetical protein ACOMHN_044048 [Nucella lapillus]